MNSEKMMQNSTPPVKSERFGEWHENIEQVGYSKRAQDFLKQLSTEQIEALSAKRFYHVTSGENVPSIVGNGLQNTSVVLQEDVDNIAFLTQMYEKYGLGRQRFIFENYIQGGTKDKPSPLFLSVRPNIPMYAIPERVKFTIQNLRILAAAPYVTDEERARCVTLKDKYEDRFINNASKVQILGIDYLAPPILSFLIDQCDENADVQQVYDVIMRGGPFALNENIAFPGKIEAKYIRFLEQHDLDKAQIESVLSTSQTGAVFDPERIGEKVDVSQLSEAGRGVFDAFLFQHNREPTREEFIKIMEKGPDPEKVGENVSKFFASEKFREQIAKFPDTHRNDVVGVILEYYVLHPDGFRIEQFLSELQNTDYGNPQVGMVHMGSETEKEKLMYKSVLDRLDLKEPLSPDAVKKAFEYVREHVLVRGFVFHGFNGTFEESIREHGLNPEKVPGESAEFKRINEIGARHGNQMMLGWQSLNSNGNVFFDKTAQSAFRYAHASPEWFAQFVAESHWMDLSWADKQAYYRRDYDAAKKNLETYMERHSNASQADIDAQRAYPNMTDVEKQDMRAFFEKYWQQFAGPKSEPKVAMIKLSAFNPPEKLEEVYSWERFVRDARRNDYSHIEQLQFLIGYAFNGVDARVSEKIAPENIVIASLPNYDTVHPR